MRSLHRLSFALLLLLPCASAYSITLVTSPLSAIGKSSYLNILGDRGPFSYTLPPQTTFTHLASSVGTCTTPAVGETGVITCQTGYVVWVYFSISANTPSGTVLTHSATSGGTTVTTTSIAGPPPNLNIVSTFPSSFVAGASPTYTITITNQGPLSTGPLSISDDLLLDGLSAVFASARQISGPPSSCKFGGYQTNCTIPSLNQGDSVQFSLTVNTMPAGNALDHRIMTQYSDYGYADSFDETAVETMLGDLVVSSSAQKLVGPNDDLPYSIIVSSTGPSAATNVTYSWTTPPGTTFQSIDNPTQPRPGSTEITNCTTPQAGNAGTVTCSTDYLYPAINLAPGIGIPATISAVTIHVRAPGSPGTVTNRVSGTSDDDSNPANNTSSATTTVLAASAADLSLTMHPSTPSAVVGSNVTYYAGVSNAGPSSAQNVRVTISVPLGAVLTSPLPAGCTHASTVVCTVATLAKGGTVSFGLGFTGTTTGTAQGNAIVSSDTDEIDSSNNTAAASCLFTPHRSDLRLFANVTPQNGNSPVVVGDQVAYHVFITSSGPDPVTAITTFTFPPGLQIISAQSPCVVTEGTATCAIAVFPNAGPSFEVWCRVTAPGTYTTPVILTTSDFDPDLSNNIVNITITANATQPPPPPGLAISIDPTSIVAMPGVPVTFTIHLSNTSAASLANVNVIDSFPAGLDFISAVPSAGTCPLGLPLLCYAGTLAAGDTATIRIVAMPPDSGSVTNQVTVSSNGKTAAARVTVASVPTARRHAAGH